MATVQDVDRVLEQLAGAGGGGRGGRGGGGAAAPAAGAGRGSAAPTESFASIAASVLGPLNVLQDADEQPVSAVVEASTERIAAFRAVKAKWDALVKTDLPLLNRVLREAGAAEVRVP